MQSLNIDQRWFDAIDGGEKSVEGRLENDKIVNLTRGEKVKFACKEDGRQLICNIIRITPYNSLNDYLISEGLHCTLPGIKDFDEGVAVYETYYSKESQIGKRFFAIELKVVVHSM